jgi:hypothetical protein
MTYPKQLESPRIKSLERTLIPPFSKFLSSPVFSGIPEISLRVTVQNADLYKMSTEQALTHLELAQLLDGAINEPGPAIALALCDLGPINQSVADRVFTRWVGALTEHDVVLPLDDADHKLVAVIRMRARSGVEAEMLADKLIARASDAVRVGDTLHRVQVHVGLAQAVRDDTGQSLLARANDALQQSYGVDGRNWARVLISQ